MVNKTDKLAVIDGATGIQRILAGNYEAAYLSWDLDPDPDPFAIFHSSQAPPHGQNLVFYSNPQADKLIDLARREMVIAMEEFLRAIPEFRLQPGIEIETHLGGIIQPNVLPLVW